MRREILCAGCFFAVSVRRLFAPGDIGAGGCGVEGASENEEVVAEAVDESRHQRVRGGACGLERCNVSLGPTAYGSCHVGLGGGGGASGEYEGVKGGEYRVEGVDALLHGFDVGIKKTLWRGVGPHGEGGGVGRQVCPVGE